MDKIEGTFISYGNEITGLNYKCNRCYKNIMDYDIWWKHEEIKNITDYKFRCKKCGAELTIEYDINEDIFWIY